MIHIAIVNIKNIDRTAPEVRTKEIEAQNGTFSLKVTAEDSGDKNSGLK